MLITTTSLRQLLAKAIQIPVPQSNTSDIEKTMLNMNSLFIRFVVTSIEEIGIDVLLNKDNSGLIGPLVDWLTTQFVSGVEQSDKKTILRIFKYLFLGLRGIGPKSTDAKSLSLADAFLNKRSKEQWA